MLKRIPKSDISIRPFKAYKEWSFDNTSAPISGIYVFSASIGNVVNDFPTASVFNATKNEWISYYPASIYGQLRAQFYNGQEDNPFFRSGDKTNVYDTNDNTKERYLNNDAKVISIPQIYTGEGIKKGSVVLSDSSSVYIDDSYGNLINSTPDTATISRLDLENNIINFTDSLGTVYSASFQLTSGDFDLGLGTINVTYDGNNYDLVLQSIDANDNMVVTNIPFLGGAGQFGLSQRLGNIFYTQGLIVFNRSAHLFLKSTWDLSFKSTETIYENEYLLIVNESEFNVSTNPSAIIVVNEETGSVENTNDTFTATRKTTFTKTITNPGVKYIRKKSTLENGNILDYRYTSSVNNAISGGFEHYDLSGSIDSTGSFLNPFITTIGLYDDNCELVAVAKLPKPIKSEPDIPVNFIVRFDT
jgi:hypothetical protein